MLLPNISRWPHFLLVWHDLMENYGRGPERLYNIGSNKYADSSGVVKHARDCQIPFRLIFIILITPILASKVHPSTHRAPPSLNCHGTHHARVSFVAHRNVGGEGPKVLQRQSKYASAYHHIWYTTIIHPYQQHQRQQRQRQQHQQQGQDQQQRTTATNPDHSWPQSHPSKCSTVPANVAHIWPCHGPWG